MGCGYCTVRSCSAGIEGLAAYCSLPPPPASPAGLIKLFNRNEDMLATVIGHECAHAVARHSSEKLSLGLFVALAVQVSLRQCTTHQFPYKPTRSNGSNPS